MSDDIVKQIGRYLDGHRDRDGHDLLARSKAEIERLRSDLEWTRQQWVNGEEPLCEDVCEIQCKGPCGVVPSTNEGIAS